MSPFYQKLALWLVFGLIFVFMWTYFNKTGQPMREIAYSDFLERVEQGLVRGIRIEGEKITGEYIGVEGANGRFKTYMPRDADLIRLLREKRVNIKVDLPEKNSYIMQFLAILGAGIIVDWSVDFLYATNAEWWQQSPVFWQESSALAFRPKEKSHLC